MFETAIRVISMASAKARRDTFSEDASDAGIKWAYFDALRLPEDALHYDSDATTSRMGRALRPGEIGCYASHYSLWCWFLKSTYSQLVVFEDDVLIDWAVIRLLATRDLAQDGIHILKLYATHPPKAEIARYKLFSDHSHLLRLQGYCYGTQAYLVTRVGAEALARSCEHITMPIDWAMSRYWKYGIDNYAVFPFPVLERLGPSTIGHTTTASEQLALVQKVKKLTLRLRDRGQRALADFGRVRQPFGPSKDLDLPLFDTAKRSSL